MGVNRVIAQVASKLILAIVYKIWKKGRKKKLPEPRYLHKSLRPFGTTTSRSRFESFSAFPFFILFLLPPFFSAFFLCDLNSIVTK
ncbi:hypothetical protein FocnCong_v018545 [Fusarium oxysporum f. sp. conglutinans]|nr:hypothetical protein FocnCong_v018545 [Fusarium oxysporum f. sp. conglutinans]